MSTRGICDECAREYVVTAQGVMRQHWAPYEERRQGDWTCPGAGRPPRELRPDPIAQAVDAAEARGRQWAIDALRDEAGVRDWQHANLDAYQRSFMPNVVGEFLARYLEHLAAHPDHSGG